MSSIPTELLRHMELWGMWVGTLDLGGDWPSNARNLIFSEPEYLSTGFEEFLAGIVVSVRRSNNEEMAGAVERQLTILRRCREVGVDQALSEVYE